MKQPVHGPLFVFLLLQSAAACSLDFDQFPSSAKKAKDAGPHSDGGVQLGDRCADDGARACEGHASRHTLICRDSTWQAGSNCAQNERCDSRSTSTEGDCVRIPAECSGRSAGGTFCDANTLRECGVDLVSFEDVACGAFGTCEMGTNSAKCTCTAGHAHTVNGACSDIAEDAGQDSGESDDGNGGNGGTSGTGEDPKPPKNKAPSVEVVFPPSGLTDRASINVRGHVTDPEGDAITKLTVNGKSAKVKSDGSFKVTAPLEIGTHALALHVEDERGAEGDSDGSEIERLPYWFQRAADAVLDADNDRVIALDGATDAIVAISLDDGARTIIVEPAETPVGRNSLELDAANDRVLVTETNPAAIAWIDLSSGERTPISDIDHGTGTVFVPHAAVLDPVVTSRAFVTATGTAGNNTDVLYTVDLTNGTRTPFPFTGISGARTGSDIAYDQARSQLLVVNYNGLIGIAVANGAAHVIANYNSQPPAGHGAPFPNPNRLAIDGDRVILVGGNDPSIYEVSLLDGTIHMPAALWLGDEPWPFGTDIANSLAFDPATGDALVLDIKGRLLRAGLRPGQRAFVSNPIYGGGPVFKAPVSITNDSVRNRWVVADAQLDALVAVNKRSGDRSVLSDAASSGPAFDTLVAVGFDDDLDEFIALDLETLYRVDPISGERTVIASDVAGSIVGSGPSFAGSVDLLVNGNGTNALVIGCYGSSYPCASALISIDLANGNRTVVSANGTGNGPLEQFTALSRGPSGYLVTTEDWQTGAARLLSIHGTTGERTVISDANTGEGPTLASIVTVTYDADEGRAALVTAAPDKPAQLLGVDLVSGDRTLLSDPNGDAEGPHMGSVRDVIGEEDKHRLVFAEDGSRNDIALLAVDTADRRRTMISDQGRGDWGVFAALFDSESGLLYGGEGTPDIPDQTLGVTLITLDPRSQERTIAADGRGNTPAPWQAAVDLALDTANDRMLGIGFNLPFKLSSIDSLVAVDLSDGTAQVLGSTTAGTGVAWESANGVAWDGARDRILLSFFSLQAIVAVDPDGERTLFSGGASGEGPVFVGPGPLAMDAARDRLLVIDDKGIVAVDLTSGDRTPLADTGDAKGPDLVAPGRIVVDDVGNRVVVLDRGNDAIDPALIQIGLDDGTRSTLVTLPRAWYVEGVAPSSMNFDGATEIAYVGSLYALDVTTGQYILIAGYGP